MKVLMEFPRDKTGVFHKVTSKTRNQKNNYRRKN